MGYISEIPSVITWDNTSAVPLQTDRAQLTYATMNCALMQAEERVFRILLDTVCMGFQGPRVVLAV